MLGYLIGYLVLLSGIILSASIPRIILLWFPFFWFIFVGFRFENGTDWFSTLELVERSVTGIESGRSLFTGYNLVDSELIVKGLAFLISVVSFPSSSFFILIAAIKAILIWKVLGNSGNPRLTALVLLCIFFLHFPFNAMRQGLALLATVAFLSEKTMTLRVSFLALAVGSHWASIPAVTVVGAVSWRHKIRATHLGSFFVLGMILLGAFWFSFGDDMVEIISGRFLGNFSAFRPQGLGIKFWGFLTTTTLLLFLGKPEGWRWFVAFLIGCFLINFFIPIFLRYFYFLVYLYTILVTLTPIKSRSLMYLLFLQTGMIFAFEWQEIFRALPCSGCGIWLPYQNILFR